GLLRTEEVRLRFVTLDPAELGEHLVNAVEHQRVAATDGVMRRVLEADAADAVASSVDASEHLEGDPFVAAEDVHDVAVEGEKGAEQDWSDNGGYGTDLLGHRVALIFEAKLQLLRRATLYPLPSQAGWRSERPSAVGRHRRGDDPSPYR